MSGGTDSLTVAIAAHRLNKTLNCYTFRVDGKDSEDSIYAKKACEHFGWNFKLIDVPVDNIENGTLISPELNLEDWNQDDVQIIDKDKLIIYSRKEICLQV